MSLFVVTGAFSSGLFMTLLFIGVHANYYVITYFMFTIS